VTNLPLGNADVLSTTGAASAFGNLGFADATNDWYDNVEFGSGEGENTFSVEFNPGEIAAVFVADGVFGSFFPTTPALDAIDSVTGSFTSTGSGNQYTLDNDLAFSFDNGIEYMIGANSTFLGIQDANEGREFSLENAVGLSWVIPGSPGLVPGPVSFQFSQTSTSTEGLYTLEAAAVPTPALLPGLLGMGVAALRKRKQEAEAEV
jgi:hypothetical protein